MISKDIFIIGRGSSLIGFDFNRLKGERVIAVNHAISHVPFAECMVAIDFLCFIEPNAEYWKPIIKDTPIYVDTETQSQHFNVKVMSRSGYYGFDFRPNLVVSGSNSGYMAINVAYHLGGRRIFLLGFDMVHLNGQRYFDIPDFITPPELCADYTYCLDNFESLAKAIKGSDLKIYNCSLESKLDVFDKVDINNVL